MLGASGQIRRVGRYDLFARSADYGYFEVYGKSQQLAGISDGTGRGVIENTETERECPPPAR